LAESYTTLTEDLLRGEKDAWKKFYVSIVDLAFKSYEDRLKIEFALAIATLNWAKIASVGFQLATVTALKTGLKTISSAQEGAEVTGTGIAIVHKGEEIVPAGLAHRGEVGGGGVTIVNKIYLARWTDMDEYQLNALTKKMELKLRGRKVL